MFGLFRLLMEFVLLMLIYNDGRLFCSIKKQSLFGYTGWLTSGHPRPPAALVPRATYAAKPAPQCNCSSHATLRLHVPHATVAPAHPPLHASAPMHVDVRLIPADARLPPADTHAGGDRYARRDRSCMHPLPMPANVTT